MLFCRFAMCFSAFFLATALVHAQNDFRIDVDSAFGGEPITTEPGFTSLDATTGNGSSVVVDGTTFTAFSAAGSRNRNTGTNPLARDFLMVPMHSNQTDSDIMDQRLAPCCWLGRDFQLKKPHVRRAPFQSFQSGEAAIPVCSRFAAVCTYARLAVKHQQLNSG